MEQPPPYPKTSSQHPTTMPLPQDLEKATLPRRQTVHFSDDVLIIPYHSPPEEQRLSSQNPLTIRPLTHADGAEGLLLTRSSYRRRTRHHRNTTTHTTLLLLCSIPLLFTLGVTLWALHNPRDMCLKAPSLATFFNGLSPAALTVLPGLLAGFVLVWGTGANFWTEDTGVFMRWNRVQCSLTMVCVALFTVVFCPWVWEVEGWGYEVHCGRV